MTLDVPQFALHVVGIIWHPSLVKSVTNTIGQELWLDKICPNKIILGSIICAYGENRGVKRVYIQYIQKGDSSIKHIYKFQAPWCTLLLNITKPCPKQWLEAQTVQPRRRPVLASQAAKCKSHATLLIGRRLVARTLQRQSSAAPGGGWWWWWVGARKEAVNTCVISTALK